MNSNYRLLAPFLVAAAFAIGTPSGAYAAMSTSVDKMAGMHSGHETTMGDHDSASGPQMANSTLMPTLPGQDAFGTIQEIVQILEVDPSTDWSKVNIPALREHLVDMNSLAMSAQVHEIAIDGGLKITINGDGETLRAIHAMVLAHAPMIDGTNGWRVKAESLPDGAVLTATAADAKEAIHIQGLGFYGLMVTGSHHPVHHLNIARGEPMQAM